MAIRVGGRRGGLAGGGSSGAGVGGGQIGGGSIGGGSIGGGSQPGTGFPGQPRGNPFGYGFAQMLANPLLMLELQEILKRISGAENAAMDGDSLGTGTFSDGVAFPPDPNLAAAGLTSPASGFADDAFLAQGGIPRDVAQERAMDPMSLLSLAGGKDPFGLGFRKRFEKRGARTPTPLMGGNGL